MPETFWRELFKNRCRPPPTCQQLADVPIGDSSSILDHRHDLRGVERAGLVLDL